MAFLSISPIADQLIGALCNTLLHSLWQGISLAAVTGLIIIFTKKTRAVTRYNLLITALVIFTVAIGITFAVQFKEAQTAGVNQLQPVAQTIVDGPSIITSNIPLAETPGFANQLFNYLNTHHNPIVLVWFLIICAKSIQLMVGLLGTRRLRKTNVSPASSYWNDKMQLLVDKLNITQVVGLLESGIAKVPMVIGNLKPVILIPIGLLTALSTEEVEAILVHELAHIKRRDYLVNLLQSLMEIVFFFNPAVLWISQLIKTERENCCDDLALAQSSNKVSYIRALLNCEEYQQAVPAYAMGLPGSKNSLLDRVKRMASNHNHSLNLFEKTILAVCLVLSGLCFSAFSQQEKVEYMANKVAEVIHNINVSNTQPQKMVKQTQALKKQIDRINNNTALVNASTPRVASIDTVPAKPEQPAGVRVDAVIPSTAPIGARLDPINVKLDPLNVRLDNVNVSTNVKSNVSANVSTNLKTNVNVELHLDTTVKKNVAMKYTTKNDKKSTSDINYNFTYKTDSATKKNYNYNFHTKVDVNHKFITKNDSVYKKNYNYNYEFKAKDHSKRNTADSSKKVTASPKLYTRGKLSVNPTTSDLADELLKQLLITNKTNLKVILNNKELIINGVKQSEKNHQLILKKFAKNPDDKVDMNFSYSNKSN